MTDELAKSGRKPLYQYFDLAIGERKHKALTH